MDVVVQFRKDVPADHEGNYWQSGISALFRVIDLQVESFIASIAANITKLFINV
jgi:hypothetical protein